VKLGPVHTRTILLELKGDPKIFLLPSDGLQPQLTKSLSQKNSVFHIPNLLPKIATTPENQM
jgi:hypothetical protein